MQPTTAKTGQTITVAQAASLLMLTEQWVRDLARRGYLPKPEAGRIPLVGAVQGYLNWLKDEGRRAAKTAAQSEVAAARAREIELRNAKAEAGLIDREDVEETFAEILAVYAHELDSVAAVAEGRPEVRKAIDAAFAAALNRARRTFAEAIASARSGRGFQIPDRP